MSQELSRIDQLRVLHSEVVAAWRGHHQTCKDDRAYNVVMESLLVAQMISGMTSDPHYWSVADAAMVCAMLRRLDAATDCYVEYLRESVRQPDDDQVPY